MARFVALLASGIAFGAVIALVALGFLVLYKATGVINFAHGDLMTLGAYVAFWAVTSLHFPTILGYAVGIVLMFAGGVVLERIALAPLRRRPVLVVVITTLGAAIVIRSSIGLWQGSAPKRLPSPVGDSTVNVFGAAIAHQRILIVVVTALVVAGLFGLFHYTSFGRQLRAMSSEPETAQLQGVRLPVLSLIAFGLSAGLAGLAGILIAPLGALDLNLGFGVMLTAFAAAIIGGFGSFKGVLVGSLVLGLVQQLLGGYFFHEYSDVLPFAVILIVIAIRPQGLFGEASDARF